MPLYTDIRISASIETITNADYNLRRWDKAELGANLLEGESPVEAANEAKKVMLEIIGNKNADIQVHFKEHQPVGKDEDIYAGIDRCTNVPDLRKEWEFVAKQKKSTLEFYSKKINQLING